MYESTWHHHLPVFKLLISKYRNMKKYGRKVKLKESHRVFQHTILFLFEQHQSEGNYSERGRHQKCFVWPQRVTAHFYHHTGTTDRQSDLSSSTQMEAQSVQGWLATTSEADTPMQHTFHTILTDGSACDLVSELQDTSGAFVSAHSAPVSHECTFGRGHSVFWYEKNKVR